MDGKTRLGEFLRPQDVGVPGAPTCWAGTGWATHCSAATCRFDDPAAPARRPHMAQMVFLDEHIRELCGADWSRKARAVVGNMRLAAGRFPDDAAHLS
jgi:hypothetical protein